MASVIKVASSLGGNPVNTLRVTAPVKSGAAASIKAGYLVIVDGDNAGYCKAAADACDTDSLVVGVALQDSTDTASADGVVVLASAPQMVVELKAKTPANLVATMKWTNKYILDVTSGAYTLDQGTTTKGIFTLIDYDNTTDGNCIAILACNKFQA